MRKTFIIKSQLQRRYLRLIELSLIVPTFLIGGCFYYLVFTLLAEEIAIPEFVAIMLFPVLKKINIILLIALPIVFILLIGWGIILSHRLTGPIDRLNRELAEIAEGRHKRKIQVRKYDDLRSVVDNINKIIDK